jgi:hypothetical protein
MPRCASGSITSSSFYPVGYPLKLRRDSPKYLDGQVDRSTFSPAMNKPNQRPTHVKPRQIVGFSLEPAMAKEVKTEAARRAMPLKKLFEEMWQLYQKSQRPR